MRLARLGGMLGLLAAASAAFAATPNSSGPNIGGMYCGQALSGGEMVEVRTKLDPQPSGLIKGAYLFADRGENTPGDIEQYIAESGLTRTVTWRDKYGSGIARFDFDETGDSFTGAWGVNLEEPSLPWNGKRCDVPLV